MAVFSVSRATTIEARYNDHLQKAMTAASRQAGPPRLVEVGRKEPGRPWQILPLQVDLSERVAHLPATRLDRFIETFYFKFCTVKVLLI